MIKYKWSHTYISRTIAIVGIGRREVATSRIGKQNFARMMIISYVKALIQILTNRSKA